MKFPPPPSERISKAMRYYNIFSKREGLGLSYDDYEKMPYEIIEDMLIIQSELRLHEKKEHEKLNKKLKKK